MKWPLNPRLRIALVVCYTASIGVGVSDDKPIEERRAKPVSPNSEKVDSPSPLPLTEVRRAKPVASTETTPAVQERKAVPTAAAPTRNQDKVRVEIMLDVQTPTNSYGVLYPRDGGPGFRFPVGFGKNGTKPKGSRFKGGCSLLGEFRVTTILDAKGRFEMDPDLVQKSGKDESFLKEKLFTNMSSIDFDGDGEGGEYGTGFVGLKPESKTPQPFGFQTYKEVFRLYSYGLHGTQDESRIGKKITGGCINLDRMSLQRVLGGLAVGDRVTVNTVNTK